VENNKLKCVHKIGTRQNLVSHDLALEKSSFDGYDIRQSDGRATQFFRRSEGFPGTPTSGAYGAIPRRQINITETHREFSSLDNNL
jgi:hypothetical protein